jgi:hypothetical protein
MLKNKDCPKVNPAATPTNFYFTLFYLEEFFIKIPNLLMKQSNSMNELY